MALDFPTPTTVGHEFSQGSLTYTWDGSKWKAASSGGAQSNADASTLSTPQTITSNKTIDTNTNAGMMGPIIALDSGIIITIGANSILTLLR